ncbi:hypothetical protein [Ruminococcus sp.]|uniref:hypothetical protein n=1 Tax=Ruminococcus sp. TaxID=41978 RepID=UPI0025D63BC5|nr:hypothetical protein [Ruminococcus sp.]
MRYSVYNKKMRKLVFETDSLDEAEKYARREITKSRRHAIYDCDLKTFDMKEIRKAARSPK